MKIFPEKLESDREIIIKHPSLGMIIGLLFLWVSYLFKEQVGLWVSLIALVGYIFIGVYVYRSFTSMKIVRQSMKSGVNVHISGRAFNPIESVEYRIRKEDL